MISRCSHSKGLFLLYLSLTDKPVVVKDLARRTLSTHVTGFVSDNSLIGMVYCISP